MYSTRQRRTVESAVEARQAEPGPSILALLIVEPSACFGHDGRDLGHLFPPVAIFHIAYYGENGTI
jgi:hypothetical protein